MFRSSFFQLAESSSSSSSSSTANTTTSTTTTTPSTSVKAKLAPPKVAEQHTDSFGHKFERYLSYRDPNIKHLKVGRIVFEKNKALFGLYLGAAVVMGAQVWDQWEHYDTLQPMKLDARSLVT